MLFVKYHEEGLLEDSRKFPEKYVRRKIIRRTLNGVRRIF
jgi:hypothetical protein